MNVTDFELGEFFTTDGKDIWELIAYCKSPSCTMKNLKTGDKESFGINGFTAGTFHKITMPVNEIVRKKI